jgi:hypothetical protein
VSLAATAAEHEDGLALFIEPRYRARFRESFADARLRSKLRQGLAHFARLDPRFASELPSSQQRSSILGAALRGRGAPERCYVVSEDDRLDGREMFLSEALAETVDAGSQMATFISCAPGRLAYFHGEDVENRYILERRA